MHAPLGPEDVRRSWLTGSVYNNRTFVPVHPGAVATACGSLSVSHARRRADAINALVGVAPIRLPASVSAAGALASGAAAHGADAAHRPGPGLAPSPRSHCHPGQGWLGHGMPGIVHERLRCPRCGSRGARELNRFPQEGHAVFMCIFCKHTWCEDGRRSVGEHD